MQDIVKNLIYRNLLQNILSKKIGFKPICVTIFVVRTRFFLYFANLFNIYFIVFTKTIVHNLS